MQNKLLTNEASLLSGKITESESRQAVAQSQQAIEQWANGRAKNNEQDSSAQRALTEPIRRLIAADKAAGNALAALEQTRFNGLKPPTPSDAIYSSSTVQNLDLIQHTNVAFPPFDFTWKRGNAQDLFSLNSGYMRASGQSGDVEGGISDNIDAAAGVALILKSDKQAVVTLRPYVHFAWEYSAAASGLFVQGYSRGGLDAAVFRGNQLIDGIKRTSAFSDSRATGGESHFYGGVAADQPLKVPFAVASVDALTLQLSMEPGDVYTAHFGAWIECGHQTGMGVSAGLARVAAQVIFVGVQRFIAG